MANTTSGLLATAGIAPDGYGEDIALEAVNEELMRPLVDNKEVEPGDDLYIPRVGNRAVRTYARKNASGTYTTDNRGSQITFSALDDTAVQLAEAFEYDALQVDRKTWNKMTDSKRRSYLAAEAEQMGATLAEARDSSLMGLADPTLIPSANQIQGGTPLAIASLNWAKIASGITLLGQRKQRGPYFAVFPMNCWGQLSAIEQLTRFNWTGMAGGPGPRPRMAFMAGDLTIFCHNNVFNDGSDGNHAMMWGPGGVGFVNVQSVQIDDWYDEETKSYKTSPDQDYAYGLIWAGATNCRVVTIEMATS